MALTDKEKELDKEEEQEAKWETVDGAWETVSDDEWESVSVNDEPLDPQQDKEVMDNIPESLRIGSFTIPTDKRTTAFFIGAGDAMTWAYRGIKQLAGIDEQEMADDQRFMDNLYESSAGGMARAGQVWGTFFEPAGMLAPMGKARTLKAAYGKGAAVGAGYGSLGYVDKESGQTRFGNALMGGTLGGLFNGAFQGIATKAANRRVTRANQSLDEFEMRWAELMLEDVPKHNARTEVFKRMPKDFSLVNSSKIAQRRISFPKNKEEAQEVYNFYKGTYKPSDLSMGIDSIAGITSTRIRNISESIAGQVRKHDKDVLTNQHQYFNRVDEFLNSYNSAFRLDKSTKKAVDKALLDGDFHVAKQAMARKGGARLVQSFEDVEKVLDELGDQALDMGLIEGKLQNYFPRYITDHKAMLARLGRTEKSRVEEALKSAALKATEKGKSLTALEQSDIINKVLRGYKPVEGKSPFTKARSYKRIPSMLTDFYSPPEEALHSYIRNMVNDIEKYKFFGRNIKKMKLGTAEIFDVDASVGAMLNKERYKYSETELKELAGLLQTRFGIGERSPANLTQNAKNMMYISLLGNPISAATQLGDLGVSVYVNGFRNTLKAIPKALIGKSEVKVKDWGLTDQLAEEFATTKQTSRWLHRAFQWSGFKYVDRLGKDTLINSSFNKFKNQLGTAKKPNLKGESKFRSKYAEYLGDETDKIIQDIRAGKASEEVQGLLFGELADVQPISLSEVPEAYLKLPNGRIAYMLKTFMLKQVDVLRRDMYNQIKKGNVAKGLANGARYALIMGAAGTASQQIKNEMLYMFADEPSPNEIERFEDIPAEFGMNALKTFGWSEYVMNKIKDGKPYEAAMDAFAPPFDIIDTVVSGDPKAMDYIPIYGKLHHYWFEGGAKEAIERKQERERRKMYEEYLGEGGSELLEEYLGE